MATIKICDRCGAEISGPTSRWSKIASVDDLKELDKLSDTFFLYCGSTRSEKGKLDLDDDEVYDYNEEGYDYDLCEDCLDSLYKWFTREDENVHLRL
jgi:hypothetical protein